MFLKLYDAENNGPVYVDSGTIDQIEIEPSSMPDAERDAWIVTLHLHSRKQIRIECDGAEEAEITASRIIASTGKRVEPVSLYKTGRVVIGLVDYL